MVSIEYLAGIVDGEGSICVVYRKPTVRNPLGQWSPYITVGMCAQEIVALFPAYFKTGSCFVQPSGKNGRKRDFYHWMAGNKQCAKVLEQLLPHIILKKEQAKLCLALVAIKSRDPGGRQHLTQREIDERMQLYFSCRTLNSKGKERSKTPWPETPKEMPDRTTCTKGHELTDDNTYVHKNTRLCRSCIRENWKRHDRKRRAAKCLTSN